MQGPKSLLNLHFILMNIYQKCNKWKMDVNVMTCGSASIRTMLFYHCIQFHGHGCGLCVQPLDCVLHCAVLIIKSFKGKKIVLGDQKKTLRIVLCGQKKILIVRLVFLCKYLKPETSSFSPSFIA